MIKNENQKQKNKEILYDALKCQNDSRKSLLNVMQSFGELTGPIDINYNDDIQAFLQNLKKSLELFNTNIEIFEKLTKEIDNIPIWDLSPSPESEIQPKENYSDIQNNNDNDKDSKVSSISSNNTELHKYNEKTLIISETTGKVILPFELSKLQKDLENSNNKYSSVDEIINKYYSLPIALYKNPFIARFRESYRLMRYKEKSTIKEAFDLGLELMFNYNLHPAIITACKNLDELDIYLDYLDSGETDKFKIFKIRFEVLPAIVKVKHKI